MRVIVFFLLLDSVLGQGIVSTPAGTLSYDEDWGYVQVRNDAHTFWWLFTVKSDPYRPLILWLHGGPGKDSTGIGNLGILGPKDVNFRNRNSTWLQVADLVFVDSPVGAGFSYVNNDSALTTNVKQIGSDLVAWSKAFFTKHPEYQTRDFYIAGVSYGGKVAVEFARQLQDAIDTGEIKAKLAGVNLGNSWISSMDFVNTWGLYLHAMSYIDSSQLRIMDKKASECQGFVDNQNWYDAMTCWREMAILVEKLTKNINWTNILKSQKVNPRSKEGISGENKSPGKNSIKIQFERGFGQQNNQIVDLMNRQMREKFKIIPSNVGFGTRSGAIIGKHWGDFMTPNYDTVDNLLKRGILVTIMNGQLDLICTTLGVELWLKRLTWSGNNKFLNSEKEIYTTSDNSEIYGFYKKYQNLQMFYVLKAGHVIPRDAPWAALEALKIILKKN
ncbi:hypothetical protein FO519_009948 [Halicephalobus sp. NKZ332]|nr:hypothetical protein FO519_009948 [Halicephalobus sp. NKZ332]